MAVEIYIRCDGGDGEGAEMISSRYVSGKYLSELKLAGLGKWRVNFFSSATEIIIIG